MTQILIPKYPLDKISNNFMNRPQTVSVDQFVSNNFINSSTTSTVANATLPKQINNVDKSLLNSILTDYGSGPISKGLKSLQLINSNVITGSQNQGDIFGNVIIYGGLINFSSITLQQGETIILLNLSMNDFVYMVPLSMRTTYMTLIDEMVSDLKLGEFITTKYSSNILSQSKSIAQTVLNNGTNI